MHDGPCFFGGGGVDILNVVQNLIGQIRSQSHYYVQGV